MVLAWQGSSWWLELAESFGFWFRKQINKRRQPGASSEGKLALLGQKS